MDRNFKMVLSVVALILSAGCATGPERVTTDPEKSTAACKCKAKWSEAPPAPGKVSQEEIKASESDP